VSTDASTNGAGPELRKFGTDEQREMAYRLWTENKSIRKIQQTLREKWPNCPCGSTSTISTWINAEREKRKAETKLLTDAGATRELLAGTATNLVDDLVTVLDVKSLEAPDVLKGLIQLMGFLAKLNGANAPVEIELPPAFTGRMQLAGEVEQVLAEMRGIARQPNGADVMRAHRAARGEPPLPSDTEEITGDHQPGN
jgi:hypothetical protein